jgi:glycosyltransferase involved in cell wall biosynthesis
MKTPSPFVSVIIPFYNNEEYAERAIESVLQQTFKNYELILVDNNSTDGTWDILNNYRDKYPDMIRVFKEPKQGCPAARNKGLQEARGEWIQILDSDDEILPEKLEHQVPFTSLDEIELVVGPRYKYKVTNNKLHKKIKYPETGNIYKALLLFRIGSTNSCLWKKQTLLKVNGWNESWTSVEDYEMFFRLIKNGVKIAFSISPDSIVHLRDNSMSRSLDNKVMINHIENAVRLRLLIKEFLFKNGLLTKDLNQEFETDLYFKLLRWQPKAPNYIKNKIKELNLKVPVSVIFKYKIEGLKRKASGKLKKIILRK